MDLIRSRMDDGGTPGVPRRPDLQKSLRVIGHSEKGATAQSPRSGKANVRDGVKAEKLKRSVSKLSGNQP